LEVEHGGVARLFLGGHCLLEEDVSAIWVLAPVVLHFDKPVLKELLYEETLGQVHHLVSNKNVLLRIFENICLFINEDIELLALIKEGSEEGLGISFHYLASLKC